MIVLLTVLRRENSGFPIMYRSNFLNLAKATRFFSFKIVCRYRSIIGKLVTPSWRFRHYHALQNYYGPT